MLTLGDTLRLLENRLVDARIEETPEEGRRRAAVAVVLRDPDPFDAGDGVEMLLIKRAENPRDLWSGHMALPGGRWDPTDASLAETALRETREEVGLHLSRDSVLGRLGLLRPNNPLLPPIDITPFVVVAPPGSEVVANHEVAAHFWVPVELLRGTGPSASFTLEVLGEWREWPAYPYEEHLIWGLTERILSDFFSLLDRKET
jgi:8-oxo-dGTP pyrophosphatase MutT (NUDIX family)